MESMKIDDDDPMSLENAFCNLFLCLGAHVDGGKGSRLEVEASEAASAELLRLLNNGVEDHASVASIITTKSICQQVLNHFFGGDVGQRKALAGTNAPEGNLPMACAALALGEASIAPVRRRAILRGTARGRAGQFFSDLCGRCLSLIEDEDELK